MPFHGRLLAGAPDAAGDVAGTSSPLIVEIDDPSDERVADYVRLKDPDLRRLRERGEGGDFFIAEGVLVIRALLASTYRVRSLLLTPTRLEALGDDLGDLDVPLYVASQDVVNEVSGYPLHRGALASADRPVFAEPAALCEDASSVLLCEGLNDHENVGALFRNAAAFGVDAVLLDAACCDPLYRRSVRVSMGHVLRVPFAPLAGDAESGVRLLQSLGFEVVGLTPAARADDVRTVPDRAKRALVVGAEGPGLSDAVLSSCDRLVRIPMAPGVDSLNVATAAAVALHALRI